MNITYKTIIETLCENKKSNFLFPTKKNLLNNIETFPDKFKNILNNKFYRYGIQVYDNEQNNISLWSTLIYLLNKKFILMDNNEQISYIELIKKQCINYLKKKHKNFSKRTKFSKQASIDILNNKSFNPLLIELLSFIFQINIIVFNFKSNEIHCISSNKILNCMKPFIIVGNYNNFWEPIHNNNNKIFKYNDIIKKILSEDITYYEEEYLEKDLIIIDNILELLDEEKKNLNIKEEILSEESEESSNLYFTNKKSIVNNYTKSKLIKMKKNNLVLLANDLGININSINTPNKKQIINLILDNDS